jgi:hypothetical protein
MTITDDKIGGQIFKDENSKKFFKNFLLKKEEIKKIDDLNAFFEKVKNVLFVVIKFDGGYDVNQLFEGLNSKGKILSTVQLTKNSLLGCAKDDKNTEKITQTWENIEGSFERKNVVWFDKFLRHQGFYKYGYVSNANLFVKINEDLKRQVNYLEFSQALETDALLYLKIRKAELIKSDIFESLSQSDWIITQALIVHLSNAELDQVFSVLFSMAKYAKINNSYVRGAGSNFLVDLKRLWAFSILAKYLDTKPSLFERDFASYCHKLSSGVLKDEDRKNFFTKLQKIMSGASKDIFILNLNKRIKITGETDKKLTAKNNRNYVSQLLLFYLEDGRRFAVEGCKIEHIIPKGKKDGLQKWCVGKLYIKEVRDKSRYRLGNLTLLNKDELGNESFDKKLKYYEKDGFSKNKLLENYKELFNSENPSSAVNERGKEIGGVVYDLLIGIVEGKK